MARVLVVALGKQSGSPGWMIGRSGEHCESGQVSRRMSSLVRSAAQHQHHQHPKTVPSVSHSLSEQSPTSAGGPLAHYERLVASGQLHPDAHQQQLIGRLQLLHEQLSHYRPPLPSQSPLEASSSRFAATAGDTAAAGAAAAAAGHPEVAEASPGQTALFGGGLAMVSRWFGGGKGAGRSPHSSAPSMSRAEASVERDGQERLAQPSVGAGGAPVPRGLYMWGGVGTGKTMLMDMFYEHLPVRRKRRVHFHAFMLDVQQRIYRLRHSAANSLPGSPQGSALGVGTDPGTGSGATAKLRMASIGDPLPWVAQEIATESWLLCFDEFQVTEVADALILRRLFGFLFERGAVMVATSNRPPEDLYEGGLNRSLFVPFIGLLRERCDVWPVRSPHDYRLRQRLLSRLYLVAQPGDATAQALTRHWLEEIFQASNPSRLPVSERVIQVAQQRELRLARCAGPVAMASFTELCGRPLGPADYLALAGQLHTLILLDVPRLTAELQNEARRFITLVDILYEAHVRLAIQAAVDCRSLLDLGRTAAEVAAASAASAPASVSPVSPVPAAGAAQLGGTIRELQFSFDRTVSRLLEMQSERYWEEHEKRFTRVQML